MARQVGERQDGWQEKKPERAASPRPAVAPESPGIPAGPPHVRVMTLERVGQQEWRRLVYGGGDCRRQPPLRGRPHQNVNAEASPQQMADRQPAECGRAAGPPHGPDRRIKHPRLRVAHERASAEPAGVPERRVPMPGNRAGDREVVRQKQEREIVAERARLALVRVIDAGPAAVDDQPRRNSDKPGERDQNKYNQSRHGGCCRWHPPWAKAAHQWIVLEAAKRQGPWCSIVGQAFQPDDCVGQAF